MKRNFRAGFKADVSAVKADGRAMPSLSLLDVSPVGIRLRRSASAWLRPSAFSQRNRVLKPALNLPVSLLLAVTWTAGCQTTPEKQSQAEAERRLDQQALALEQELEEAWKAQGKAPQEQAQVEQEELGPPEVPGRVISSREIPKEVYRLRFGDQLDISVWGHADLTMKVPIREDGSFSFPLIGDVQAAGSSLREVEQEVQERLDRDYIVNPQVTIRLTGSKFSIFGEVAQPGSYPIEGSVDLLTAISLAGGITKFGSSSVEIIRWQGNQKLRIRASIDRVLRGKEPNVEIWPQDTIHVRRRFF